MQTCLKITRQTEGDYKDTWRDHKDTKTTDWTTETDPRWPQRNIYYKDLKQLLWDQRPLQRLVDWVNTTTVMLHYRDPVCVQRHNIKSLERLRTTTRDGDTKWLKNYFLMLKLTRCAPQKSSNIKTKIHRIQQDRKWFQRSEISSRI